MFYSTLIFLIAFLPLFTMRGVEGVIFSPMSHTYAFALTAAILLAVMLTPVLSSLFAPHRDEGNAQCSVGSDFIGSITTCSSGFYDGPI